MQVPWNASWSSEDRYEIRPCRWAEGRLAIWSPHSPGVGKPLFAKPHMVRQRRSIAELRCTVCGEKTEPNDRWWFPLGHRQEGWWMSTEAPVHSACADVALQLCPRLRALAARPIPFPDGATVLSAIVGGAFCEPDYGVKLAGRRVIGHMKLAWRVPLFRPITDRAS